jgi:glucose-1-phosphate adenylyltransferase
MRAVGIILAGGNNEGRLGVLTDSRAAAAMPVGSCYRAIDFTLSSMSSSGINKVAVLAQYNSRSLQDHLSSSKWWDFGRKQGGLFVFTPFTSSDSSNWFRGTADSIYQNISYLRRSNEPYVVISSGDCLYKMDYRKVLQYHEQKGADITVVCKNMPDVDLSKFGIMELDEEKRLLEFEEKPLQAQGTMASLGIYVISRTLLIDLLEEIIPAGRYDFVKDIIIRFRKTLKIYGYEFEGYWSSVGMGISEYYNANMDFLKKEVREFFVKQYPFIETKPKDEPPAKYNMGADVSDAIVGSGSIINGRVEHAVIFRRVYIGENSVVKDSIIMEGSYVGNHCVVQNAILDKNVVLSDGKQVIGTLEEPIIIKKGTVI